MKFIEINDNVTINTEAITRIERLESGRTMVVQGDQTIIAEIPYDTMVDLLQTEPKAITSPFGTQFTRL